MNEGVRLRAVIAEDVDVFFRHQQDPVARHMAAFGAQDPADVAGYHQYWGKILANGRYIARTVELEGAVAGNIVGFHYQDLPHVGYWIGREFWGRGVATRALELFLREWAQRPLFARAAKDNLGSLRVLEKCGFLIVGEARGFAQARKEEVEEYILQLPADRGTGATS